jgi:hypothetical protein
MTSARRSASRACSISNAEIGYSDFQDRSIDQGVDEQLLVCPAGVVERAQVRSRGVSSMTTSSERSGHVNERGRPFHTMSGRGQRSRNAMLTDASASNVATFHRASPELSPAFGAQPTLPGYMSTRHASALGPACHCPRSRRERSR